MPYDWKPTHFDGVSLQGSAPFDFAVFDERNGPAQFDRAQPVETVIPSLGSRFVRDQPEPATWELLVFLSATAQSDWATLAQTFSREKGLAYLRADDGTASPVNWRLQCHVLSVDRIEANEFRVVLRVPKPVWEENTETTSGAPWTSMSGDSASGTITNNGKRRSRPTTIEVSANARKTDPDDDFTIMYKGFVVNRSPYDWENLPVLLLTLNTQQLISDAAVSSNNAAIIDAAVTTIDVNTPVGGGLPSGQGFAMVDSEQIYYGATVGSPVTQLQLCVRGVGGTSAAGHTNGAVMTMSKILKSGDDIRVYVNGREVERWLAGFDTATTKVWANLTMPRRTKLTWISPPVAGGSPADGADIEFEEGVADLPESGIIWGRAAGPAQNELISYKSRDVAARKIKNINRMTWITDAGELNFAVTDPVYRCDVIFVVAMGKRQAGGSFDYLPDPIDRRPAIQLKASTNTQWRYGDQADDANTVFWDSVRPGRTAMWLPTFEVPEPDNKAKQLVLDFTGELAEWVDKAPVQGRLLAPRLMLTLPQTSNPSPQGSPTMFSGGASRGRAFWVVTSMKAKSNSPTFRISMRASWLRSPFSQRHVSGASS